MKPAMDRELLELENEYWRATKDKDGATAGRLTDETCILAGPAGVRRIDRSALQGLIRAPKIEIRDFTISDHPEVQFLTDDVAVVAYDVQKDLSVDGRPATLD